MLLPWKQKGLSLRKWSSDCCDFKQEVNNRRLHLSWDWTTIKALNPAPPTAAPPPDATPPLPDVTPPLPRLPASTPVKCCRTHRTGGFSNFLTADECFWDRFSFSFISNTSEYQKSSCHLHNFYIWHEKPSPHIVILYLLVTNILKKKIWRWCKTSGAYI